MEAALTVLQIVTPVFLLAAIGFVWVKAGFAYDIQFVTRLAMSLAVPALVFSALTRTEVSPGALSIVTLAAIAAYGAIALAAWLAVRLQGLEIRTYLAPMIFGNTGNVGLPLALFAYGQEGLGYAVVIFAVSAVLVFTLGIWLVSGGASPLRVLREPMVLATLAGAVFLWRGWKLPEVLDNSVSLLGQMAIPLMLITLGVAVARLKPERVGRTVWLSLLRSVLTIAIAAGVAAGFGLPPVATGVLILQMSAPVAVTSYLLAERYRADSGAVASLVVTSTLLAIGTIPLTLAFLL
ncbi:MAG TPA: AEC family transporter [Aliiroseovarius sp.]|nr:AEC family transporter [Aliiroseovarius sp.]